MEYKYLRTKPNKEVEKTNGFWLDMVNQNIFFSFKIQREAKKSPSECCQKDNKIEPDKNSDMNLE